MRDGIEIYYTKKAFAPQVPPGLGQKKKKKKSGSREEGKSG